MFDFSIVTNWIHELLLSVMPEGWAIFIECIAVGVCIVALYAILAIVLIYMERKVCGFFQCRLGPNRVGKWGSIQVICDVLKMLTKEIFTPKDADRFLYNLAPFMVIIASFLTFACIPFNKGAEILNFNVGVFFLLAASSIGVVGILLAGWGSNNKFSLIGAMRSGAQIISYELSVGMSIMTMVVLMGTMQFSEIVEGQADGWFIFKGHIPAGIAFIIYLIAGNAECNRGPFDLPEAESELTAGYHTEYSGMGFGFFYLAEYLTLFITAGIATTLFLGGWMPLHIAGLDGFNAVMDYIPGAVWFLGKTFFVVFLLMWIRWTYPRLRIDQVLTLEWKYIMPLSLVILLVMAVTIALSLNACTFTDQSETSNMVDESVSVDQGGQVIRVDIPNGDGTFTTLEGEEAQKWYDKAGEEDQQEAAEEASTQSIEDVK